jgi:hypothetical protein
MGVKLYGTRTHAASSNSATEAVYLGRPGGAQPMSQRLGYLASPDWPRAGIPVLCAVDLIQNIVDKLAVQFPYDRLIVGIADIRMCMMNDKDFLYHALHE